MCVGLSLMDGMRIINLYNERKKSKSSISILNDVCLTGDFWFMPVVHFFFINEFARILLVQDNKSKKKNIF